MDEQVQLLATDFGVYCYKINPPIEAQELPATPEGKAIEYLPWRAF